MLSFDAALQQLLAAVQGLSPEIEQVALFDAPGRVLAEAIVAAVNVPPEDNSAMDGIAFCFDDLPQGGELPISQTLFAGMAPTALMPTTAVRLFTGSVMPENADTVVLQEDCEFLANDTVRVKQRPKRGQHIRKAGEDIAISNEVLSAGELLDARHIGLLASIGHADVTVYKALRIGLLATGDELIMPGQDLTSGQIYNSNLPMLTALLKAQGFVVDARHVQDDLSEITTQLQQLADSCDVVLTIGGVSVGDADFVKTAIKTIGSLDLWKVAMKPGKPLSFGKLLAKGGDEVAVMGLPGNPVSAFATYTLFAKPYLRLKQGMVNVQNTPVFYPIRLNKTLNPKREEFVRVRLLHDDAGFYLQPYVHQGSGVLSSVAWATGFARLSQGMQISCGQSVSYLPFS